MGCRGPSVGRPQLENDSPRPSVVPITAAELRKHVEFLASDDMAGRATPSPQLDRAARYVADELTAAGALPLPGAASYEHRFDCSGRGEHSANVLGYLPGGDSELSGSAVLVSAHYDHIGVREEGDDRVYNGANDNASGVAVMLALTRHLRGRPLGRSVVFAAFCGEELGLLGSAHYVSHPAWPLERTAAVVNLEMLGRADASTPVTAWVTGYDLSTFGAFFGAHGDPSNVRFVPGHEIGPVEGDAFDRSDNYPFATAGVVAHTISTGRLDDHYHAPHDEAASLDYERMATLANAIADGVVELTRTDTPPTWTQPPSEP